MKYQIIYKESFHVAGIRALTKQAGGVWQMIKQDGRMQDMMQIAGKNGVTLGLCFGFDAAGYNDNMVGFLAEAEKVSGYEVYHYPASKWIKVTAQGKISDGVLWHTWQQIHETLLDGHLIKQRAVPTMEDYVIWDEANDRCQVDIYIAVASA